jgi:hypothetical protein
MNTRTIVAVILVILGVVALGYSGIAFATPEEAVDFCGLRILQHAHHYFIPQVVQGMGETPHIRGKSSPTILPV